MDKDNFREIFDLFKLEYDSASQRFENIYRAMWQIFYYMAVLSAGILTFGVRTFPYNISLCIALTPLVFWFLAAYIPMNTYGQNTRTRLKEIEEKINIIFGDKWSFNHYLNFANRKPLLRTSYVVYVFGIIVILLWVFTLKPTVQYFYQDFSNPSNLSQTLYHNKESFENIQNELSLVSKKLDDISIHIE